MSKIRIITDTAGDIPLEVLEKYSNILLLPIEITFGDQETVKEHEEIGYQAFFRRLVQETTFPKTCQVTPPRFLEAFRRTAEEGYDTAICFTLSKEGSGTFQSANLAKKMAEEEGIPLDITVVDTMSYSLMYGRPAAVAAEMAAEGKEKEEILSVVQKKLAGQHAIFAVDTVKYLKMGGRIKPAVAAIAEVLDIKPILSIKDGLVEAADKVRGRKKVLSRMIELAKAEGLEQAKDVWVIHADLPEKAEELKVKLEQEQIRVDGISYIGPTIGVNTGPGAVAIVFYT